MTTAAAVTSAPASPGLAFLPMYDVPGTRAHGDALWVALRDALRARGIAAPDALDRSLPRMQAWRHPGLLLGQTCGMPYISHLCDAVELAGTPDYGVQGCAPGHYHSTLVVRASDTRDRLPQFLGAALALNGVDSQSGYGAVMRAAAPHARQGRFFGKAVATITHTAAMHAVADGQADIASIDSVTWRMSLQADPVTARLKAIGTTEPTPGLPFITSPGDHVPGVRAAVHAGVAALAAPTRAVFALRGVVDLRRADYEVIARWLAEALAVHSLPPLEPYVAPSAA